MKYESENTVLLSTHDQVQRKGGQNCNKGAAYMMV